MAGAIQERPFDVDAEHAGHARHDGRLHRRDRARNHVEIVADQRGQEARGAEAPMRAADGADRVARSGRR